MQMLEKEREEKRETWRNK